MNIMFWYQSSWFVHKTFYTGKNYFVIYFQKCEILMNPAFLFVIFQKTIYNSKNLLALEDQFAR